jgi:signal transduction histidine kinase
MIVDAAGVVHEGNPPLARLHAVANAPIFSYDESFIGHTVGGPILWIADSARVTAAVALRILGGEKPRDIKIEPVQFGHPVFDWRELQRWGISESRLLPGSEIRFRDPTVWQRYGYYILAIFAALLMQSALIVWLFYEHRRRQVAEAVSLQRANELAQMNRIATAGQLSATIAHEIRQPLAAISAFAIASLNWLKRDVPDFAEARASLQKIVEESHRADDIIKSVRTMFDHEPPVREEVDLNKVVHGVLAFMLRTINSNNITLNTRLADDPAPLVMADPVQLQQVLLNLIMNAIEAMTAVRHKVRLLHIETGIDPPYAVWLTVADSGPGLDPKVAESIFDPFVTTKTKGMGMGLSICKSIIEQHQGQLEATSVAPQGAMFRVTLPHAWPI